MTIWCQRATAASISTASKGRMTLFKALSLLMMLSTHPRITLAEPELLTEQHHLLHYDPFMVSLRQRLSERSVRVSGEVNQEKAEENGGFGQPISTRLKLFGAETRNDHGHRPMMDPCIMRNATSPAKVRDLSPSSQSPEPGNATLKQDRREENKPQLEQGKTPSGSKLPTYPLQYSYAGGVEALSPASQGPATSPVPTLTHGRSSSSPQQARKGVSLLPTTLSPKRLSAAQSPRPLGEGNQTRIEESKTSRPSPKPSQPLSPSSSPASARSVTSMLTTPDGSAPATSPPPTEAVEEISSEEGENRAGNASASPSASSVTPSLPSLLSIITGVDSFDGKAEDAYGGGAEPPPTAASRTPSTPSPSLLTPSSFIGWGSRPKLSQAAFVYTREEQTPTPPTEDRSLTSPAGTSITGGSVTPSPSTLSGSGQQDRSGQAMAVSVLVPQQGQPSGRTVSRDRAVAGSTVKYWAFSVADVPRAPNVSATLPELASTTTISVDTTLSTSNPATRKQGPLSSSTSRPLITRTIPPTPLAATTETVQRTSSSNPSSVESSAPSGCEGDDSESRQVGESSAGSSSPQLTTTEETPPTGGQIRVNASVVSSEPPSSEYYTDTTSSSTNSVTSSPPLPSQAPVEPPSTTIPSPLSTNALFPTQLKESPGNSGSSNSTSHGHEGGEESGGSGSYESNDLPRLRAEAAPPSSAGPLPTMTSQRPTFMSTTERANSTKWAIEQGTTLITSSPPKVSRTTTSVQMNSTLATPASSSLITTSNEGSSLIEVSNGLTSGQPMIAIVEASGYDAPSAILANPTNQPQRDSVEVNSPTGGEGTSQASDGESMNSTSTTKWHPFEMNCSEEVDDKGEEICEEWARSGLCTTNRPTMFLFCRRTCLCVGPPPSSSDTTRESQTFLATATEQQGTTEVNSNSVTSLTEEGR